MRAWLRHHWQSLAQTAARLAGAPFSSLLNVLVIGIALALPLGGYALLVNMQGYVEGLAADPEISVFMSSDASKSDVAEVGRRLKGLTGVKALRFVPRDVALAGLKKTPGLADAVATLKNNPLPDAFIVALASRDTELAARIEDTLRALPRVAHVQSDMGWVQRIEAWLRVGRTGVMLLATMLSLALVAATFNTIRLQILTQRSEIEVAKLIGATDSFIRRPFFHFGAALGVLGGSAALAMVWGAFTLLNLDVAKLAGLYDSDFRLRFLEAADAVSLVAFSALLGWLGAFLSVSRHLAQIEPR